MSANPNNGTMDSATATLSRRDLDMSTPRFELIGFPSMSTENGAFLNAAAERDVARGRSKALMTDLRFDLDQNCWASQPGQLATPHSGG